MTIDERKYYLNNDMSKEIQQTYSRILKKKHCFENVKNLFITCNILNNYPNWRIALGVVYSGIDFVYVKHAFFVDENRKIIEVTIPYDNMTKSNTYYYIVKELDKNKYSQLMIESRLSDLRNLDCIKNKWNDFEIWARQNKILII